VTAPLIQLDNVTKLYGRVIGVNDISIELAAGAYGLLGPNGSGKSTLLNLITGQLRPSLGQVRVQGESPLNNDGLYRRIGYCPSSEGMYATVSALEWVRYLLELYGMGARQANEAAERALELVGMTYAMHRAISGYSRGMRQRTKLAQAVAHDPGFLILDEPFNGLDPVARHDMSVALRNWITEGKSLLLASHVLHEVESITPSFLLICGGRLLASGTAEEVNELLVDLPNDITLRTSQPNALAQRLVEKNLVNSVQIETDRVVVSTRVPSQLLAELPEWTSEPGYVITEVRSADESLQALFNTLLQIHRGEI
jgi:ABC-2 type transport system ATP-binding protein